MNLKKSLLSIILTISFFCVPGYAIERKKPLPLKELQNPNGPSYVPIPYPQTDDEVITDLKYFFYKRINPSKNKYSAGDFSAYEKTMRGFIEGKDVVIGEIFRVKNKLAMWERDYTFFIRLRTLDNIWLADICMDSDGHYSGSTFLDIDIDKLKFKGLKECNFFKPYLDKAPIIKQIKEKMGYELNEKEISNMQLVDGQSPIADMFKPALEITLTDGRIFYKSFKLKAFYAVESKLDSKSGNYRKILTDTFLAKQYTFDQTVDDKILILKELWREK